MAITITDLKALDFGYLKGSDLVQFCAPSTLITQYTIDPDCLQNGCAFAYGRIQSHMNTKYDMSELTKRGSERAIVMVELVSILAVRAILGSQANISELMISNFKRAEKDLLSIRMGEFNLPLKQAAATALSTARLVDNSFQTLG